MSKREVFNENKVVEPRQPYELRIMGDYRVSYQTRDFFATRYAEINGEIPGFTIDVPGGITANSMSDIHKLPQNFRDFLRLVPSRLIACEVWSNTTNRLVFDISMPTSLKTGDDKAIVSKIVGFIEGLFYTQHKVVWANITHDTEDVSKIRLYLLQIV